MLPPMMIALIALVGTPILGVQGQSTDVLGSLDARVSALSGRPGVSASTLVSSRGGRVVRLLTLALPGEAPVEQRPGLLLVAGMDGRHRVGISTAVGVAERLAREQPEWLARAVVYVVPCVNPDGVEAARATPRRDFGRSPMPADADRDQRIDEDPAEDLNGDGVITMMRVKSPGPLTGLRPTHMPDPDEPRLMRAPDPNKGERATHVLLIEGTDNDGDGEFNEDGAGGSAGGGVDFDMQFPAHWPEFKDGAGQIPLEEPAARALVEWTLAHPNVSAVVVFGRHDNLVNIPEAGKFDASGEVPIGIEQDDKAMYEAVAKSFKGVTGMTEAAKVDTAGSFGAWAYAHFGVPTFMTPVWARPDTIKREGESTSEKKGKKRDELRAEGSASQTDREKSDAPDEPKPDASPASPVTPESAPEAEPEPRPEGTPARPEPKTEEAKWLRYSDDHRGGAGFVEWRSFEHPQLGPVEIGGFVPGFTLDAPDSELDRLADEQAAFVADLVGRFPRVEAFAEAVSLGPGVYRVAVRLTNSGVWPTSCRIGVKARRSLPVIVTLQAPVESIVSGERVQRSPAVAGGGGTYDAAWVVLGRAGESVRASIRLPIGRSIEVSAVLP